MPSIRDTRGTTGTQGMLRGARTTAELPGQETRAAMGRGEHLSRGSYINYYDDLKLSTTPDNADTIRKQEGSFQAEVADRNKKIQKADTELQSSYGSSKKQLELAKSKIPDFKSSMKKAWDIYTAGGTQKGFVATDSEQDPNWMADSKDKQDKKFETLMNTPGLNYEQIISGSVGGTYRQDFVDVSVTHNGKVEGTYKVPRTTAMSVAGNNALKTQWVDKAQKTLHVDVDSSGRKGPQIGEELHVALGTAAEEAYNSFYEKLAPDLSKSISTQRKAVDTAYGQLEADYATQSATIGVAKEDVASKVKQREGEWEVLRTNYDKKKATIADIFSKMKVNEAGNNAENV